MSDRVVLLMQMCRSVMISFSDENILSTGVVVKVKTNTMSGHV